MSNSWLGRCGNTFAGGSDGFGNIYGNTGILRQGLDPVTMSWSNSLTPISSTTCTEGQDSHPANSQVITLVSPVGSAPEAPTVPPRSTMESAPPRPSSPSFPPTLAASTTSCIKDDDSRTQTSSPLMSAPRDTPTEVTEPPRYGSGVSSLHAPGQTAPVDPDPPGYSHAEQPPPIAPSYSAPSSPGSKLAEPPASTNCSSSNVPEMMASETTLWPKPSAPIDPPVPSHVPGSDSTHSRAPRLTTIGGLAFVAAMMV